VGSASYRCKAPEGEVRLLLDTHVILWSVGPSDTLPRDIQRLLADERHDVFVSIASFFEVAMKRSAGRRHAPRIGAERALVLSMRTGFEILEVKAEHAIAVETLAISHGDPFDRLLLAQAQIEGLQLVTHDGALAAYDPRTILF
jgi:PIN domain nuclease of toxin-antitoxin system